MRQGQFKPLRGSSLAALAFTCLGAFAPSVAKAFCLARSCDPDAAEGAACARDVDGCSSSGVPLRRSSACLSIAVSRGSAANLLGITDGEFEQAVGSAFGLWANANCGTGNPAFAVRSLGAVTTAGRFACTSSPPNNLDVWQIGNDLPNPPVLTANTGVVAGRTTPTFTTSNGRVFDADVDLNRLWFVLHNDDPEKLRGMLRTVAAHEAGHALGLAHSQDPNSLMYRSYVVTPNRLLTADDVQGICRLFPPQPVKCMEPTVPDGALGQAACDAATAQGNEAGGCIVAKAKHRHDGNASALSCIAGSLAATVMALLRRRRSRVATESSL